MAEKSVGSLAAAVAELAVAAAATVEELSAFVLVVRPNAVADAAGSPQRHVVVASHSASAAMHPSAATPCRRIDISSSAP